MPLDELNNPLWSALGSAQSHFALGGPAAKRYPAEVAPFIAVPEPGDSAARALAEIVSPGEIVNIVAVTPQLKDGWELIATGNIVQMIWREGTPVPAVEASDIAPAGASEIVPMGASDIDPMLALTALVFPGYFRRRTPEMGDYFGIRMSHVSDGSLAAMAGERMKLHGCEEVSAVCTHPDHTGRGHAARLINLLVKRMLDRGATPFLHVNETNQRARALYERLGFVNRATLPLWLLKKI